MIRMRRTIRRTRTAIRTTGTTTSEASESSMAGTPRRSRRHQPSQGTVPSARSPVMRLHAAFLRGVSPMNAKMPELRKCFEAAGFAGVKTVLSSGNVVFSARGAERTLERKAEKAMSERLGRAFLTIVRSHDTLREILESDPWDNFRLSPHSKRVVTFLREAPRVKLSLPIEVDGARILCVKGREVFTAYLPS